MNKNDLRYIKTEETIIDAFSKCVYELGFERTTIAAICQKARISRNTFYFHYEDKYDLLNTLYANLETKLGNSLEEHTIEELKHYSIRDSVEWTYSEIEKIKKTSCSYLLVPVTKCEICSEKLLLMICL